MRKGRSCGSRLEIREEAARVLEAEGCYVMPGFIDLHVHLRDPGLEYKETLDNRRTEQRHMAG